MCTADFNPDADMVTVRDSKSGKPRHVVLTNEGQKLFTSLTAGKESKSPIFTRADGGVWRNSHQLRPIKEACKHAKINPIISFNILRHTHGSALAMQGVPMPVIAKQLGHADTRMTEKHYAHLSGDYVADTIRAHFPTLGIGGGNKVAPLKHQKRS
jgi:integrase